jgi:peptidoglycan-associated lipoprotein
MKRFLLALSCAALLVGCGSSVKLDDVAVEDKTGTPVGAQGAAGAAGAAGSIGAMANSGVAAVDLTKSGSNAAIQEGPRIIYFDYDSFVIKPDFQSMIETHARHLRAEKSRHAVIEGHTDDAGGREYNLALGQKRAEAVRRALGLLGVADSQLEAVSYGKEKPAALGTDEASMAQNRRAEIIYR